MAGETGYAKYYLEALKSGKSDEEAHRYATQKNQGSGLTSNYVKSFEKTTGVKQSAPMSTKYTNYVRNNYDDYDYTPSNRSSSRNMTGDGSNWGSSGGSFPYESLLRDLLAKTPTYTPRSRDELRSIAESRADQQLNSLLSAIASRRAQEEAKYNSGKSEIEAAYATLPQQIQARLDEARRSALESAIARGMGRSGVVDWQTEKLSSPIMQEEARANAEKAAKLGTLANSYNALISDLARQEQEISGRRGSLVDNLLEQLWLQEQGLGRQSSQDVWSQALSLANLANSADQFQQSNLNNIIQQLLYG